MSDNNKLMKITEAEIEIARRRYIFMQSALAKLVDLVEISMKNDNRWFSIAPKVARKCWKQALSLEILFKHDWSIEEDGMEKIVLDISSYYALLRAMYEAYATFVHLFRIDRDPSENMVRFRLWELDGLQSRLNFKRDNPSTATEESVNSDRNYIEQITDIIKGIDYYKGLPEKQQIWLLKNMAWKFSDKSLRNKESNKWQHSIKELIERTNIKEILHRDIYSLYSMHAHTGYISILQNDDLSNEDKMIAKWVAITNGTFLVGYMLRELASRFKEGKPFIDSFSGNEKLVLDSVLKNL